MLIKSSARWVLAMAALFSRETSMSLSRVSSTWKARFFSISALSLRLMARVMSFSRAPNLPLAPTSIPPVPGSMTIVQIPLTDWGFPPTGGVAASLAGGRPGCAAEKERMEKKRREKKASRFAVVLLRPINFAQTNRMVEAAGIEPASGDIQLEASTCISSSLISPGGVRRGQAPSNQPQVHFTHRVRGKPGSLSCWSTPLGNRRREPEKRLAYTLGSNRLCFCTYLFPLFYDVDGISACSFRLTIPVESVRPHPSSRIIESPEPNCQPSGLTGISGFDNKQAPKEE